MRNLNASDVFRVSEILDKCDIDISGIDSLRGSDIEQAGIDIIYKVARKMHKAEAEVYGFLADIAEVDVDEVKAWGIKKLVQVIKEIVANEDFADFFPS